jgi:twitching motility protein PilU
MKSLLKKKHILRLKIKNYLLRNNMNFDVLLKKVVELQASDLFIAAGKPLCVKVHGSIVNLTNDVLTADKAKNIVMGLMSVKQQDEFLLKKELNFAIQTAQSGRFRVSAYFERFNVGAVLRRIKQEIPSLEELGLPANVNQFAMLKRGLVLLVGATGVGKSSTLAAMLDYRNHNSVGHIITIEDPIEFIHEHDKCIVTQREVGIDTESFGIALKNTLRQAPDVILIGEIRSSDTMEYAMQFAETGHLCLATLHANNANQALDRIIHFFPAIKHQQIWLELSLNLKAIVAQQLVPSLDGSSRVVATEILINTPVIQSAIRKGEVESLKEYIAKGGAIGMHTFDQSLFQLYKDKKISFENAVRYADSESEMRLMIRLDSGGMDTGSLTGVGLQE